MAVAAIHESLTGILWLLPRSRRRSFRPRFGYPIVDGKGLQCQRLSQGGKAPIAGLDIPGGEHARPKLADRDHRHRDLVGEGVGIEGAPGLAGDEDRSVGKPPAHRDRTSSVVSGASSRSSTARPASA